MFSAEWVACSAVADLNLQALKHDIVICCASELPRTTAVQALAYASNHVLPRGQCWSVLQAQLLQHWC